MNPAVPCRAMGVRRLLFTAAMPAGMGPAPVLMLVLVLVLVSLGWPALAQTDSFQPGRVEELQPKKQPQALGSRTLTIPQASGEEVPPQADEFSFVLRELRIQGATVYSNEELLQLYGDRVDKEITVGDIYRIANALTVKYREDGYVLSQAFVPQQRLRAGAAEIRVVEGYIDGIVVTGPEQVKGAVERALSRLLTERPTHLDTMERALLLANDVPGVTAQALLRPSPDSVGASQLIVTTEFQQFSLASTTENYVSRFTGNGTSYGEVTLNSPFGYGMSLAYNHLRSIPTKFLTNNGTKMELPLGGNGLSLSGSYLKSKSLAADELRALDVRGNTVIRDVALNYPLIKSRTANLSAALRLKQEDVEIDVQGVRDTDDSISSGVLELNGTFLDPFAGLTFGEVALVRGLGLFNATSQNDPIASRDEADPEFTRFEGTLGRLQSLGEGFDLMLMGKWQYANEQLYSSHEFGVGGNEIGRGYDFSEIVGERGVAGTVELRYFHEPEELPEIDRLTYYGFYDIGQIWNVDHVLNGTAQERISLASAGVGIKIDILGLFTVRAEYAEPLTLTPASQEDRRFYFGLDLNY